MMFELICVESSSWWLSTLSGNVLACPVRGNNKAVHPTDTSMAYAIDFSKLENETKKGLFDDIDEYLVPLLKTDLPKRVSGKEKEMLFSLINKEDRTSIESVNRKLSI
ncbi:hypothetical protein LMH73_023635 [Vibrio splendidus]|nr:hypothetical protein [Vibrio splendidus]MCC4882978.1 hypothetical protein [Vibrio splendidus]